jgi:hypothetical protein
MGWVQSILESVQELELAWVRVRKSSREGGGVGGEFWKRNGEQKKVFGYPRELAITSGKE